MKFPNALAGVKKIYTAEILALICAALILFAAFMALFGNAAMEEESLAGVSDASFGIAAVVGVVSLVLMVVSFVLNIIGLKTGAKDEPKFKTALTYVIIGIAASVVSAFVSENLKDALERLSSVAAVMVTYFVIAAIISLAEKLGDEDMAVKGKNLTTYIIVVYSVQIISGVVSDFANLGTLSGILGIVSAIAGVVQTILYLTYLAKATKMLTV